MSKHTNALSHSKYPEVDCQLAAILDYVVRLSGRGDVGAADLQALLLKYEYSAARIRAEISRLKPPTWEDICQGGDAA